MKDAIVYLFITVYLALTLTNLAAIILSILERDRLNIIWYSFTLSFFITGIIYIVAMSDKKD